LIKSVQKSRCCDTKSQISSPIECPENVKRVSHIWSHSVSWCWGGYSHVHQIWWRVSSNSLIGQYTHMRSELPNQSIQSEVNLQYDEIWHEKWVYIVNTSQTSILNFFECILRFWRTRWPNCVCIIHYLSSVMIAQWDRSLSVFFVWPRFNSQPR